MKHITKQVLGFSLKMLLNAIKNISNYLVFHLKYVYTVDKLWDCGTIYDASSDQRSKTQFSYLLLVLFLLVVVCFCCQCCCSYFIVNVNVCCFRTVFSCNVSVVLCWFLLFVWATMLWFSDSDSVYLLCNILFFGHHSNLY